MASRKQKIVLDTNILISFLITGDKDLLELDPLGKTRIITISDFLGIID